MPLAKPSVEQIAGVEEMFSHWRLYKKLEDHNYLYHRQVYARLHRFLLDQFPGPFAFLDLGCGDAEGIVRALEGTGVAGYLGVDLAPQALARAAQNLSRLSCEHRLLSRDFAEVVADPGTRADVIWMGLTFHHLPPEQKAVFLPRVRRVLTEGGYLLMYEPTRAEGETRERYLDRWWLTVSRLWRALPEPELRRIQNHVWHYDFPETFSALTRLADGEGFSQARRLFQDPEELYALLCFRA